MPPPLTNGPLSIDLIDGTITINDGGSLRELLDSRGCRDYAPGRYDKIIGVRGDGDDYVLLIETNVQGRISYSELSFDGTTGRAERGAESVSETDLVALETLYGADLDDDGNIGLAAAATEVVRNATDGVGLVEVAGAYGIDATLGDDTNAPVILSDSLGRSEWAPGTYDSVIGVRQDGTDVVVLVEPDVRGRISYSEHRFDATTGQEQRRAVAVDAAALPGLEAVYVADLNGDEQAGYVCGFGFLGPCFGVHDMGGPRA